MKDSTVEEPPLNLDEGTVPNRAEINSSNISHKHTMSKQIEDNSTNIYFKNQISEVNSHVGEQNVGS